MIIYIRFGAVHTLCSTVRGGEEIERAKVIEALRGGGGTVDNFEQFCAISKVPIAIYIKNGFNKLNFT